MNVLDGEMWEHIHETASYLPNSAECDIYDDHFTPFCVTLKQVDYDVGAKSNKSIDFFATAALFNTEQKVFFGRQSCLPVISHKIDKKSLNIAYNQNLYFYCPTKFCNQTLLTIEFFKINSESEQLIGWTFIKLNDKNGFDDVTSTKKNSPKRYQVYIGSSNALLQLENMEDDDNLLMVLKEMTISILTRTHNSMESLYHLFPENTVIGTNDTIPGLCKTNSIAATANSLKKCLTIKTSTIHIEKLNIKCKQLLAVYEEKLCQTIFRDMNENNQLTENCIGLTVLERKCQIGLHNGWCYVDKPDVVELSIEDESSNLRKKSRRKTLHAKTSSMTIKENSCLSFKKRLNFDCYFEDTSLAIIFMILYTFEEDFEKTVAHRRGYTHTVLYGRWHPSQCGNIENVIIDLFSKSKGNPDSTKIATPVIDVDSALNAILSFNFYNEAKMQNSVPVSPRSVLSDSKMVNSTKLSETIETLKKFSSTPPLYAPDQLSATSHLSLENRQVKLSQVASPNDLKFAQSNMMQISPRVFVPPELYTQQEVQHAPSITTEMVETSAVMKNYPIIADIPGLARNRNLDRVSFARIYEAGFPQILDTDGELPTNIDVNTEKEYVADYEAMNPLKTNEIIFQFLTFKVNKNEENILKNTKTVFFTFKFYRFPCTSTERLLLSNGIYESDSETTTYFFKKIKKNGEIVDQTGYQINFNVDPEFLNLGEVENFLDYMKKQSMYIDIWNADSLLYIGSFSLELKSLLRQNRKSVMTACEVDVIEIDYIENYVTTNGVNICQVSSNLIEKGVIQMRIANIGKQSEMSSQNFFIDSTSMRVIEIDNESGFQFMGGNLNSLKNQIRSQYKNKSNDNDYRGKQEKVSRTIANVLSKNNRELNDLLKNIECKYMGENGDLNKQNANLNGKNEKVEAKRLERLDRLQCIIKNENSNKDGFLVASSGINEKELNIGVYKERALKIAKLDAIGRYREQIKSHAITNMLRLCQTNHHTLYVSMGVSEFFEFPFQNPFNNEQFITIEWNSSNLYLITNSREWRCLKNEYNIFTPIEESLFGEYNNKSNQQGTCHKMYKILLKPKEKVFIPFKYISMDIFDESNYNKIPAPFGLGCETSSGQSQNHTFSETSNLNKTFKDVEILLKTENNKPLSSLSLHVNVQTPTVSKIFRFYQAENTFFKKSIRIVNLKAIASKYDLPVQMSIRCNDTTVICEAKSTNPDEAYDIFLKCTADSSPYIKTFYISVYSDQFMIKPAFIWQFFIHSLQKVDVLGTQGQTTRFTILLRGDNLSRLVKCYCSSDDEMKIIPEKPFMLPSNSLQEICIGIRSDVIGRRQFYINAVDMDSHLLLRTWLISLNCIPVTITKAFDISVPCGFDNITNGDKNTITKSCSKKISYTNPYKHRKIFHIRTNKPNLMQLRNNILDMEPYGVHSIGLTFLSGKPNQIDEILLFINDEEDKNEETFCIRVFFT
ncbi:Nephrocystin-4 [Intoshia linei]|uniref:Nephrocystin-4 n=1 Tax=Intoshia linei TaxID=1819745 RepID=A0A177BCC5_9BILA|nr:Nephrocystin-4 [Intoshia linei]